MRWFAILVGNFVGFWKKNDMDNKQGHFSRSDDAADFLTWHFSVSLNGIFIMSLLFVEKLFDVPCFGNYVECLELGIPGRLNYAIAGLIPFLAVFFPLKYILRHNDNYIKWGEQYNYQNKKMGLVVFFGPWVIFLVLLILCIVL